MDTSDVIALFALLVSLGSGFFSFLTWTYTDRTEKKRIRLRHQTHLVLVLYRNFFLVKSRFHQFTYSTTPGKTSNDRIDITSDIPLESIGLLKFQIGLLVPYLEETEMSFVQFVLKDFFTRHKEDGCYTLPELEYYCNTLRDCLRILKTYFEEPDFASLENGLPSPDETFIDFPIKQHEAMHTYLLSIGYPFREKDSDWLSTTIDHRKTVVDKLYSMWARPITGDSKHKTQPQSPTHQPK